MAISGKRHVFWEGTLLRHWWGDQKKCMQECQKIHQLDSNAKGKRNPFLNNFSLPWHTPTWVGLWTMRPPEDFELPLDWVGMKCFGLPWQATQAPEGRSSCLPPRACSRPQHAPCLLRQPPKRKTTFRKRGVFSNPAELANVGAVCWYLERCGWRRGWLTRTPYNSVSAEVPVSQN